MRELSLKERMALSPEEKKRRYQEAVKPVIAKNFKNGVVSVENYIGTNDSPTAGLTKENFARSTEGYAANNDGTYRYYATRELGIPDQIDQNPRYAAKDRMQYYLIDHPNAFNVKRELKTANDYWGNILTIMSQDSEKGRQLEKQAQYFSTQYGNPLYNPYQISTLSPNIREVFGMDNFSSEWITNNYDILRYLERNASGSAKAPDSKSTPEQIMAYYFSKIVDAESDTLKAEQELAALKSEISSKVANAKLYGTGQSVDDIFNTLDMKQYKTLQAMEDQKNQTNPFTLTRAVNYSTDTVYGMIQAAMDAADSDISDINDFTIYGAKYSNEKFVDGQEQREKLLRQFYEDERERYRQEQDALLAGDTSVQERYAVREIAKPETNVQNGDIFNRDNKPKNTVVPDGVTAKPGSWSDIDFSYPAVLNPSDNVPEVGVSATERNNAKMNQADVSFDPIATEAEIQRLEARLEAVDSDKNAMPMDEYTAMEEELERLKGLMRTYKASNTYMQEKYSGYKNDPEYMEYARQGAQMESTTDAHEQYSDTYADPHAPHTSMTAEEITLYNYLLAKEGEAAADAFVADMQETINARQGEKVAEALEDRPLAQVLYSYSSGVMSSIEGFASAFSDQVRPVGASDYARQAMSEENGAVMNLVNDLASSTGNMTPGILLSALTGVLGAPAAFASGVGAVTMGVSASGNAYNQVMRSGDYSPSEARVYASLVGASEALLSYAIGGISKLGGGKALEGLSRSINKIDNVFLRAAAKMGKSMGSEAVEEYLQAQIEPILQSWILGMEIDFNILSEDAMYSALMGALTAGMLESPGIVGGTAIEVRNERAIGQALVESGKRQQMIDAAKQSENMDVRQAAEALDAGTIRATEATLGQLAIEYRDNGGDLSFLSEPVEPEVQPTIQGITTDYDTAQALTRAMRGEATESDVDLLENSASIPGHEDTAREISAAAREFSGVNTRYNNKEQQLYQVKQDLQAAQAKLDEAKSGLAMHLRGVVRMQNGEVLGRELIAKHHIESQIQSLEAEAEAIEAVGLDPADQNSKLAALRQQLSESQTKVDELTAGGRESTVFQGQVTNAQKGFDAANRNYSVVEMELDNVYYEYRAAENKFRERVSNAVNTAFGQNALGMLEQTASNILANKSEQQKADFIAALSEELGGNPDPEAVAMLADFLQLPEAQEVLNSQRADYEANQRDTEQAWLEAKDQRQAELDNAPGALLRALNAIKANKQKGETASKNAEADARLDLLMTLKAIGRKRVQEKQERNDEVLENAGQGASYLGRARNAAIRNESVGAVAQPIRMSNQKKHKSRQANRETAAKVADVLVRQYNSKYGSIALANEISGLYNYITESANDYDEVSQRINAISDNILKNTRKADKSEYDSAKADFKNARVSLTDSQWQEIESDFGSRGNFRNKVVKHRINVTQDGIGLRDFLSETHERHPWLVDTNVSDGELVMQFVNAINELYTPGVADYDGDVAAARAEISNYIQDAYYGMEANTPGAYTQDEGSPGAQVREIEGLDYSVFGGTIPFNQQPTQQQNTKPTRGKPVSSQMIIQQASSDFEIPARSGVEASFAGIPNPVNAYYNSGATSMRLPQDLWNFTHELGHHLNNKYQFSSNHSDMAEAMAVLLPNQFYEAYTQDRLTGEAVAEMVRLFVVNEAAARQFGGNALDTFMKELSFSDRRKLRALQSRVREYTAQTVDEINRANSSRSIANMDQRTAQAKIRDGLREIRYNYVDNLEAAERLDRQAQKELGFLTQDKHVEHKLANYRRGNAVAANILTDQLTTPDGALVGAGFMSTLDGLNQKQYAELSQYLADMRAMDWLRHTEIQNIDGSDQVVFAPRYVYDPKTTSETDIQNRINNTSAEVKAAAEKVWEWFRNYEQIWLVDSGRMSQSDFDTLWNAEPHYVPLRRVLDYTNTSAQAINRGLEQISNQIIGVEGNGSSRDFMEPLTALMQSVVNITNGTLRNEVGKTLAWQLRNTNTLGNMATITPFSKSIDGLDSVDAQEGILEKLTERRPDGTNLYGVVEKNGQVTWLQINDPLLQQLMDNPNPQGVTGLLAKIGQGTNLANALATTYSTKFGLRNVIRDVNTAWRNSPNANPLSFLIDEAVSIAEVAKNTWNTSGEKSQSWLEWAAAGGLDDGRFSQDIAGKSAEKIYNLANPNKFKQFFNKVNETFGILESGTRLNLYKQGKKYALAEGQSEAASRAAGIRLSRDGTTDFNRRGAKIAGFIQLFRFGNASLEGAYQSIRALADSSTAVTSNNFQRRWVKAGFDFVLRSAYVAALCTAFMDEEEKEQYRRMDPSVKYTGLVIPNSHNSGIAGDIVVIPYPNDPVSALMSIGQAVAEGSLTGGIWDNIRGAVKVLLNSLIPISSPIWSPIWEAGSNTTWYGGKIVPSNLENRAVLNQYDEDTALFSRAASGLIYNLTRGNVKISPMKVDYVLDQYGAAGYDFAHGLTEGLEMLLNDEVPTKDKLTESGKSIINSLLSSLADGFKRNMISSSNVSSTYYDQTNFLNEVINEQNKGDVHYDLAGDLTDSEVQQAYADAKSILDTKIKPIQESISNLYDELNEVDADPSIDDAEKDRQKSVIRQEVYDLQLSGIAFVDDYKAKYCGDSVNLFTSRETDAAQSKGYNAFHNDSLPQGIRDQADGKLLSKMRTFYEQDTTKTTFTPKYPPGFVNGSDALTAWEDVDNQTKQAMEKAWTDAYLNELANNGFGLATEYDTARELASNATTKANKAAKEIYSIKYGFRE